jgi:hypothetical protein
LRFFQSRLTEAAFVFQALADPNVADGGAASNLEVMHDPVDPKTRREGEEE